MHFFAQQILLRLGLNSNDSKGIESKVELHHLTQIEPGSILEIAETTHDRYSKVLHGLVDDGKSFRNNPALRKQYDNFRTNYWKFRVANL